MPSHEYNIETLVIGILQGQSALSAASVEHHTEDAATASKANRIVVKCESRTPLVTGRSLARATAVWQAEVIVTAMHNGSELTFDGWRDAIDDALTGSVPAGVVTTATSSFPNGVIFDEPTGGSVNDGPSGRREITRTFRAVFRS